MLRIDGTNVTMAMPYEKVVANIRAAEQRGLRQIHDLPDWREAMPIALVGGGPSLHETIDELRRFRNVMVCGSAHDFVADHGIIPRWCVVCDPDPVMANYLRKAHWDTTFLVASQCDAAVFETLKDRHVAVWNCGGSSSDNAEIWGDQKTLAIGGGTTVGTRAMLIAMVLGFANQHLFGFDTCVGNGRSHAYDFSTGTETIGQTRPIRLGGADGPEFEMADYHISQLFDFKKVLELFGNRIKVTVHGDGVLAELMRLGRDAAYKLKAA